MSLHVFATFMRFRQKRYNFSPMLFWNSKPLHGPAKQSPESRARPFPRHPVSLCPFLFLRGGNKIQKLKTVASFLRRGSQDQPPTRRARVDSTGRLEMPLVASVVSRWFFALDGFSLSIESKWLIDFDLIEHIDLIDFMFSIFISSNMEKNNQILY